MASGAEANKRFTTDTSSDMDKFFSEINKYVISILFFLAGGGFLAKYLSGDELESQPEGMLYAAVALLLVGVLAMPVVLERLSLQVHRVLLLVGTVGAVWLGYEVFYSVDSEIEFQETKKMVQEMTVQRLKDIRDAQEAYRDVYGTFASDFDSLKAFMYEPVIPVSFNMGSFHDTLPEAKSAEKGYILKRGQVAEVAEREGMTEDDFLDMIIDDLSPYKVRDTLYTTFFEENFSAEARREAKLPSVSVDSLWFNPLTGERFILKTDSVETGGVMQPTILVQDPTPFGRDKVKKDTLRFGSLTDANTDGNWRN